MTMFTLPNFCRVCLKYDKNLIDLAHIENEPSETLMSKLTQCVSEVEWNIYKPLLCHPCIKRLNIAYSFKKQCIQSSSVMKNYIELVKESQQKQNESQNTVKPEVVSSPGTYMLLPNHKYVKILVGSQNQATNTFQNVFLNLIPANTLKKSQIEVTTTNKDNNQNVFLDLNTSLQKLVSTTQEGSNNNNNINKKKNLDNQKNINQLLTESKSEELSVEIDPTVFGLEDGDDDDDINSNDDEEMNDYDEVISQAKITLKDFNKNGETVQNGSDQKYYVPILPKDDFLSSGQHFLFNSIDNHSGASGAFTCESCQKPFSTKKLLKAHIKQFHLGKLPFKCEYCYLEFATRKEYDLCIKNHKIESESDTSLNKSITLQDLTDIDIEPSENGEYICNVCKRPFNSSSGLLRHKVRKHNQKNKKKYFIKGMKNAKCDICNREFSTQSYMQLHKKLHMRDDVGYKYKVFGKSKYGDIESKDEKDDNDDDNKQDLADIKTIVENVDVTPDIFHHDDDDDGKKSYDGEETDEDDDDDKKMEIDEDHHSDDNSTKDEEINNSTKEVAVEKM